MTCIADIQSFVQEYAETIAEVLELEVTIVDEKLIRIGGTGQHRFNIGKALPQGCFYQKILQTGEPGIIRDIGNEHTCRNCDNIKKCSELATMGFPIFNGEKAIGVIGIMAFSEDQQQKIVNMSSKLLDFLKHMSSLLQSKIQLMEVNQRLQDQVQEALVAVNNRFTFRNILTRDDAFLEILNKARHISSSFSTVIIRGESGTGKELLARAVHSESQRRNKPFIVVNCASIPENLLESELFGYEEGAFTGAKKEGKLGKFELANGGTIFLDEIGDMPISLQPKLLRVLQERNIDRVGGKKPIPIDVRIIAATNKNLEEMVEKGQFRGDLYYRLNVIPFFIPPLRTRRSDIPLYVDYFIKKYSMMLNKEGLEVNHALMQWLRDYHWPGNVRQLENVVEYMVNMAGERIISFSEVPEKMLNKNIYEHEEEKISLEERMTKFEKSILENMISPGMKIDEKNRVAKELGISIATLYRKLDKYGIDK